MERGVGEGIETGLAVSWQLLKVGEVYMRKSLSLPLHMFEIFQNKTFKIFFKWNQDMKNNFNLKQISKDSQNVF